MIIKNIEYGSEFIKKLKQLPNWIIQLAEKQENVFRTNPLHPSLRLHPLKGDLEELWSISLNKNYRIIFKRKDTGDILFVSIGKHDIYKNL